MKSALGSWLKESTTILGFSMLAGAGAFVAFTFLGHLAAMAAAPASVSVAASVSILLRQDMSPDTKTDLSTVYMKLAQMLDGKRRIDAVPALADAIRATFEHIAAVHGAQPVIVQTQPAIVQPAAVVPAATVAASNSIQTGTAIAPAPILPVQAGVP